jgi:hypothetical protein
MTIAAVKLRNQFFIIGSALKYVGPRLLNAVKHSIGMIEASTVQTQHQLRILAGQVKQNEPEGSKRNKTNWYSFSRSVGFQENTLGPCNENRRGIEARACL